MRHRKKGKTLDRKSQPRNLMLKNLTSSVLLYEKVTTTLAKAKAIRGAIDKAILLGRHSDLTARRQLLKILPVKNAVAKVIEDLGPRYKNRQSGFSRIVKLGRRQGDGAEVVRIELV